MLLWVLPYSASFGRSAGLGCCLAGTNHLGHFAFAQPLVQKMKQQVSSLLLLLPPSLHAKRCMYTLQTTPASVHVRSWSE